MFYIPKFRESRVGRKTRNCELPPNINLNKCAGNLNGRVRFAASAKFFLMVYGVLKD